MDFPEDQNLPKDQHHEKNSDDKAASETSNAAPASAKSGSAARDLPAVQSPRLGSGETDQELAADPADENSKGRFIGTLPTLFRESGNGAPGESEAAASGRQPRPFRFALLAATIACAAGLGALVGSLTASGIGHQTVAAVAIPQAGDPDDITGALKAQRAELSALKAGLDSVSRSTSAQLTKLTDRLNNLEHAQADPAAKLAHIADAVDRLEKRVGVAGDITGSIAAPGAAAGPAAPPKLAGPVLHDWVVQDVRNGRAMIESRYGGFFLVGAGSIMPGLGRVREVRRQNGEWIVVTDRGVITPRP
jgi:hypothetical protein